jgi:Peptidase family M23
VYLVLVALVVLINTDAWGICEQMSRPVNVQNYSSTSLDFDNGFSTLYRDQYNNTRASYFEGIGSHPGVDITHDLNGSHFDTATEVHVICDGVVERVTEEAKPNGGWGNSLTIRHDNVPGLGTIFSAYAHLDRFSKVYKRGDPVRFDELIGYVGKTGKVTGLHLHFQIDNASPVRHPFFPNRFAGTNDGDLEVNTPDNDLLVKSNTFSPLSIVQTRTGPGLTAPTLLTPINNMTIVQNNPNTGCSPNPSSGFGIRIFFDWTDSGSPNGITGYHIVAQHQGSQFSIVDTFVTTSAFTFTQCNSFVADANLDGWEWRVQAQDNLGNLSPFSSTGLFRFAPCRLGDGTPCHR